MAEKAGCHSIVAHLREARRHINARDIELIRRIITVKFNMEMSITPEIVNIALKTGPDEVTLVPERRQELTTEGGLDVVSNRKRLREIIPEFKKRGIVVSLFIDPDLKQIQASKDIGADYIEVHTGKYAQSFEKDDYSRELRQIIEATNFAQRIGLGVNAGHGLDYKNVSEIVKIQKIETLNIGYAIICRAIFVGIENAVREMLELLK